MVRIARQQIDYRTKEQKKALAEGNQYAGYSTIMPGEEVPEELEGDIVAGNPDWLVPLEEEVDDGKGGKKKVKSKGHGLSESQLYKLRKNAQLDLLRKYGVTGKPLEKLAKGVEEGRVKKLLKFA